MRALIEVHAPDCVGLLRDISKVFADERLDIRHARIVALGDSVVDTFYVRDASGQKIADGTLQQALDVRLLAAVAQICLYCNYYDDGVKFLGEDERYFESRQSFSDQLGSVELWSVIDQWPLFVGQTNLARSLAIVELLRSTLNVPGDIAEFGCWKGSTTLLFAKSLKLFDPMGPKIVHAFDSFEGLTEFHPSDSGVSERYATAYKGSREMLESCARLAGVADGIRIHQGIIEKVLPEFAVQHPHVRFSLVYCDTDLYSATKTILADTWRMITPGGLMVFDQWNMAEFPGEGIAVNEFMESATGTYEVIKPEFTRQPTLALRRLS